MRGIYIHSIFSILFIFSLSYSAVAQLVIETDVSAEDMVDNFIGEGVTAFNETYQGANVAGGIFSNGESAGIDLDEGIFLCSGSGNLIPGPNSSSAASQSHGLDGHPILTDILGIQTYDAAVLEFDFTADNDIVTFSYIFGSEEYNEYVGAPFNDIYGLFVTGPNPDPEGEFYDEENFGNITQITPSGTITVPVYINNVNNGPALPGEPSPGPCPGPYPFCEYFDDNVNGGINIEYDGLTKTINAEIPVQEDDIYHFTIVIADAADGIFDSGVLLKGGSFKSLGPAEFNSFGFLAENNENLNTDVVGQIVGNEVYLTVPDVVNVSELVATFDVAGVYVDVNGVSQVSGLTPNNFLEPVSYHLEGYNTKDWKVYVETVAGLKQYLFNQVLIGPNPSNGDIHIDHVAGFDVRILDSVGKVVRSYKTLSDNKLLVQNLLPGIYFIELIKDGEKEARMLIVQ